MEGSTDAAQPMICLGSGLPALPKKLVAKILANEYIDFSELPPGKGKGRTMPQSLEGQVIVVQAADLLHGEEDNTGSGNVAAVLCPVRSNTCLEIPLEGHGINGVSDNVCEGKPEVSLAIMGCLRPKLLAGGSRQPGPIVGKG